MSETVRFEVVRGIQRTRPDDSKTLRLFDHPITSALALFPIDGYPPPPDQLTPPIDLDTLLRFASSWVTRTDLFVDPWSPGTPKTFDGEVSDAARVVDFLRALDEWLVRQENRPSRKDLLTTASDLAVQIAGVDPPGAKPTPEQILAVLLTMDRWDVGWDLLGRSLCALLCPPGPGETVESRSRGAARLHRLVLVGGLVADLASGADGLEDGEAIRARLLHRIVVVPNPPFPIPIPLDETALRRLRLLARSGCSDLYVVREEWACYQAGEIAHIENVLQGEVKRRVFERTDESEITEVTDTTTVRSDERDTQSTERFELSDQTSEQTSLAVRVEGQVDTSGQYGPTKVDSHVGGSLDWSKQESSQHATNIARENVDRAVSRVEQTVRETRTRRTLTRTVERDTHALDNSKDPHGNVVGMYRWVNKIKRLQIFRYPNRYLIEFQIPEPGAFLRWIDDHPEPVTTSTPPPPPFTTDGKPLAKDLSNAIQSDKVSLDNYAKLAAIFGASVDAPPAATITVTNSAKIAIDEGERKKNDEVKNLVQPPSGTEIIKLTVPDGYAATQIQLAASGVPIHAIWLDHPAAWSGDGWDYRDGYHNISASATASGTVVPIKGSLSTVEPSTDVPMSEFSDMWLNQPSPVVDLTLHGERELDVAVTLAGTFNGSLSVALKCELKSESLVAWAAAAYNSILDAYRNWTSQYAAELRALQARDEQVKIEGASPARNAERISEELKRQVIEQLIGKQFAGMNAVIRDEDSGMPSTDLDKALDAGPYIQFLEQVFEWDKMTYVLYPYYWAAASLWKELEVIDGPDPDYARFLRAGSARVVLSARPGYENGVNHWLWFGQPWGGGSAPAPGEEGYISIADEIRTLTQAPDDGIPMDSWEVLLPTTLVWLDPDPSLPKSNPSNRLTTPTAPGARLCASDGDGDTH